MAKRESQKSLSRWTKQKWRTKSGKPSTQGPDATGEAYAPAKAIQGMSKKKYAAASAKKRAATRMGKQRAEHGLHKGKKR
jgi:hypothetical protein|tara:strand:- start:532 stop:771 length:240 start_codon:yes stop_codon:yes gene_type:complete